MPTKSLLVSAVILIGVLFPPANFDCSLNIALILAILCFVSGIILSITVPYGSLHDILIISRPKWQDKLDTKQPLIFYQLLAFLTIAYGFGILGGEYMQLQEISFIGVFSLAMGLGILTGIYITLLKRPYNN